MIDIILQIAIVISFLCMIGFLMQLAYGSGYEKGQVDALNGIQKYKLIEFPDGTREYHKDPKPDDFCKKYQDFKIIK